MPDDDEHFEEQDGDPGEEGLVPATARKSLEQLRETGQLFTTDGNLVDIANGDKIRPLTTVSSLKYYLRRVMPGLDEKYYNPVAADILSNPTKTAGFPVLERITTQPTFRPDFT